MLNPTPSLWGKAAPTRPFLLRFAVALILFDSEDVEVGGRCGRSGFDRQPGLVLIAIVHFNAPKLDVWTFIAPEIRSDEAGIRQRKSAERRWDVE
jgi:hypothetical protein